MYPTTILFLFIPYPYAVTICLIIHYFLCGFGLYLLTKEWKWSNISCLISSISYTFSGCLISLNNIYPILFAITWMPFCLLFIEKYFNSFNIKQIIYFSICYSLIILSGRLDIAYITFLLILIFVIYKIITSENKTKFIKIVYIVFGILLSLLISSIQLLPTIELTFQSVREKGIPFNESAQWSLHPLTLLSIFIPELLGNMFSGKGLYPIVGEPTYGYTLLILSVYCGVSVFILFFISILLGLKDKNKQVILWSIVTIIFTLISLGKYTIIYEFLYNYFPGIKFIRYPSKYFLISTFGICIMAGIGIEYLLNQVEKLKKIIIILNFIFLINLIIFGFLIVFKNNFSKFLNKILEGKTGFLYDSSVLNYIVNGILFHYGFSLILFVITIILIYLYYKKTIKLLFFSQLILILIGFQLVFSGMNYIWTTSNYYYKFIPPLVEYLESEKANDPNIRIMLGKKNYMIPHDFINTYAGKPIWTSMLHYRFILNGNISTLYNIQNAYGYIAGNLDKIDKLYEIFISNDPHFKPEVKDIISKILGIKYLLVVQNNKSNSIYDEFYTSERFFPDIGLQVYKQRNFQGRVHFKTDSIVVKSEDLMFDTIKFPDQLGFNPLKNVLILDNEDYKKVINDIPKKEIIGKKVSVVKIINTSLNTISIELETNTSGYLVLADTYYPGWKAYVNGVKTPILKANYFQKAVRVSAGKHRIIFKYDPITFKIGIIISLITLILVCIVFKLNIKG